MFLIQTYNIGIVKKPICQILNSGLIQGDIIWMKHSYKDRYFADPFLIKQDENFYYILAEEYIYWDEKGRISLLTVNKKNFSLEHRCIIIEEETHLSFPFCYLNGNTIVPESVLSGKTKKYTINLDTFKIEGDEILLNEGLIDAVFYKDTKGQKWILASKNDKPKENLYLYQYDGKKYMITNSGKPVLQSIEMARSAGLLFSLNDKTYRPVQDSTERYGHKIRIAHILDMSSQNYESQCIALISGDKNPPFNETLHTFNVYNDCIIVDGSKDYFRFPMKILYKFVAKFIKRVKR
jgi:hypothetical protein